MPSDLERLKELEKDGWQVTEVSLTPDIMSVKLTNMKNGKLMYMRSKEKDFQIYAGNYKPK